MTDTYPTAFCKASLGTADSGRGVYYIRLTVPRCPLCGKQHVHGSGTLTGRSLPPGPGGFRLRHCSDRDLRATGWDPAAAPPGYWLTFDLQAGAGGGEADGAAPRERKHLHLGGGGWHPVCDPHLGAEVGTVAGHLAEVERWERRHGRRGKRDPGAGFLAKREQAGGEAVT